MNRIYYIVAGMSLGIKNDYSSYHKLTGIKMEKTTFEEILNKKGKLIYTNVGNSMFPLIQPRDLLVITKTDKPLKKFDIPLYKRDSGQYVLHRVIKVRKKDYVLCGDNRSYRETGITDRHVLGVLTAIIRDGKTLPIDAPQFRAQTKRLFWRRLKKTVRDKL